MQVAHLRPSMPPDGPKKRFIGRLEAVLTKKLSPNICKSTYTKEILIFCILA
jgi:hypothetical protein